jgi:hypothetical protein
MELSINKTNTYKDSIFIFLIVLTAMLIRRFDDFLHPQLFAEDYSIFFLQFEQYGIKSIFMTYGGYLLVFQRLLAAFWGTLHISYFYIPVCYCFTAFFVTYFIALNIWKTSVYLGIKHRVLYATCFLFLPIASDLFMNLEGVHFITSFYLVNFLFIRYTNYTDKNIYLNLLAILLISLTGPFSALLSPVVLLVIILERKELTFKKSLPLCLILFGGMMQVICIKFIDPDFYRGVKATPEPHHLFKLITNNMSLLLFSKAAFMQWVPPVLMMILSLVVFLTLLCIFIIRYFKIENKRRYVLLWFAIIVFVAFIKAYWPNESQILAIENSRYYLIPFTCIAWLMVLSFDKKIKSIYIAGFLLCFILQSRHIRMNLPDKQWKKQIQEYYDGKRNIIEFNPDWQASAPPRK